MAINYKVLGQSAPTSTADATLYTVPTSTQSVVSTLAVANTNAASATFRIYIRVAGATAALSNALMYDIAIPSKSTQFFTIGIALNAADVVTVQSSVANALTFHLMGSEIV